MKPRGSQRRRPEPRSLQEAERRGVPAAEQGYHPVQLVDVDLPADVGATQAELAGGAQKMADGPR
jgi:hypothetical protein